MCSLYITMNGYVFAICSCLMQHFVEEMLQSSVLVVDDHALVLANHA